MQFNVDCLHHGQEIHFFIPAGASLPFSLGVRFGEHAESVRHQFVRGLHSCIPLRTASLGKSNTSFLWKRFGGINLKVTVPETVQSRDEPSQFT